MSVGIGVNSYHSFSYFSNAGDPGWLVYPDGRVRTYAGVSGADVSALRDGDEVVVLDGQKLENFRHYFETFARLPPGTAYTIVVRRDGRIEQLALRTASYHLGIRTLFFLLQPVLPATWLVIGLAIFLLKRDDKRALLLALMLGALFVGGWPPFSLLVKDLPWWLAGIMAAALLVGFGMGPVVLHFFLVFPERSPLLVRFPRLEYYLYPLFLLTAYPFLAIAAFRLGYGAGADLQCFGRFSMALDCHCRPRRHFLTGCGSVALGQLSKGQPGVPAQAAPYPRRHHGGIHTRQLV